MQKQCENQVLHVILQLSVFALHQGGSLHEDLLVLPEPVFSFADILKLERPTWSGPSAPVFCLINCSVPGGPFQSRAQPVV